LTDIVGFNDKATGVEYVNFFSAGMSFSALLLAIFLFKQGKKENSDSKSFKEIWGALLKIFTTPRLMILILIVTGFWII